jgi:hypothetical protein
MGIALQDIPDFLFHYMSTTALDSVSDAQSLSLSSCHRDTYASSQNKYKMQIHIKYITAKQRNSFYRIYAFLKHTVPAIRS